MNIAGNKDPLEVIKLLEMVKLSHRKNSRLAELSGGEQQRIAIAIALSNKPKILLADEPTGSVDSKTSDQIFELFRTLNYEQKLTIVIVTHDRAVSKKVDRVVAIRDGRTSSEFIRKKSYAEELKELEAGATSSFGEETHEELAILDKAGRLQIPREYIDALGISGKNKIKVELEGKRIILFPPE
jgi:ABC-type methionine transport system ATPase subunit